MLDYTITEKEAFTIAGIHRRFSFDTCYQEIPKFWEDWRAAETGMIGMFGVCLHIDDTGFDYWIADLLEEGKRSEYEATTIPGGQWAEFPCRGPLPESLQAVNTRIWSEWLPEQRDYDQAGDFSIEVYPTPAEKPEDNESFIWIPVRRSTDDYT